MQTKCECWTCFSSGSAIVVCFMVGIILQTQKKSVLTKQHPPWHLVCFSVLSFPFLLWPSLNIFNIFYLSVVLKAPHSNSTYVEITRYHKLTNYCEWLVPVSVWVAFIWPNVKQISERSSRLIGCAGKHSHFFSGFSIQLCWILFVKVYSTLNSKDKITNGY